MLLFLNEHYSLYTTTTAMQVPGDYPCRVCSFQATILSFFSLDLIKRGKRDGEWMHLYKIAAVHWFVSFVLYVVCVRVSEWVCVFMCARVFFFFRARDLAVLHT